MNKLCDTCCKADVCSIKDDTVRKINTIGQMLDNTGVFIEGTFMCKKWMAVAGPVSKNVSMSLQ